MLKSLRLIKFQKSTKVEIIGAQSIVNQRIAELLSKAKDPDRVFPATDFYNEGWMLRLVIDWFSRNPQVHSDIRFLEGSRWYSEALLPFQFLTRQRGDNLAESWTHADGVIGQFEIGKNADGDLTLNEGAKQLVVIEAKMFSKLSAGVTNAGYFNQAARNVASIAEIANRAGIGPASLIMIPLIMYPSSIDNRPPFVCIPLDQVSKCSCWRH